MQDPTASSVAFKPSASLKLGKDTSKDTCYQQPGVGNTCKGSKPLALLWQAVMGTNGYHSTLDPKLSRQVTLDQNIKRA